MEKCVIQNEFNTSTIFNSNPSERQKTVDLLYQIGAEKGFTLQKTILDKIKMLNSNEKGFQVKKVNLILNKILNKRFENDAIPKLGVLLSEWNKILFSESQSIIEGENSVRQILELMKEGDRIMKNGINVSILQCIEIKGTKEEAVLERVLKEGRNLKKKSLISNTEAKQIINWQEEDIKKWALIFKKNSRNNEIYIWSKAKSSDVVEEVISVLIRAVMIYDHYPQGPRDTQLMALLLFLDSGLKG